MIATVMNFTELKRTIVVVIIQPGNLERMSKGDPATLESKSMGGVMPDIAYPNNYAVLVAYEEDEAELRRAAENPVELLRYLERGRQFIPGVDGSEHAVKLNRPKV